MINLYETWAVFKYLLFCWKLKTIKNDFSVTVHKWIYCSFAYLHCSCLMNSTIGAGLKKKKKKLKRRRTAFQPNQTLPFFFFWVIICNALLNRNGTRGIICLTKCKQGRGQIIQQKHKSNEIKEKKNNKLTFSLSQSLLHNDFNCSLG